MPRTGKGPRLNLRNARHAGGTRRWVILDTTDQRIELSTGCVEGDRAGAEKKLAAYIAKHHPALKRKFVQQFTDRRGGQRFYFRRPGFARAALPPPWSPDFMEAYTAALEGTALPPASTLVGGVRTKRGVDPDTVQPLIGVYLLLLKGKVVYIGESTHMPNRVAAHRRNGRPFDKVFYIATKANERIAPTARTNRMSIFKPARLNEPQPIICDQIIVQCEVGGGYMVEWWSDDAPSFPSRAFAEAATREQSRRGANDEQL